MIPDLPDFLRISAEDRAAAWKGRKLTKQGAGFRRLDVAEERERNRLQREYDRFREEQKRARLAALRERD